jgi:hypothetical protein
VPNIKKDDLPVQILLRFPVGLRRRLAEIAKESGRSINAEVVTRLEKSMVEPDKTLRDLIDDQDILRTDVAHLRGMVEKIKLDTDAFIEKLKQGRVAATFAKLKDDPESER